MAGNRGTLDGLPEGMGVMYVTDVQYAGMQAASFSGGDFMGIAERKIFQHRTRNNRMKPFEFACIC